MADELDESEVKRAFEEANVVLSGRPARVVIAALNDLTAATISYIADNKAEALAFAAELSADLSRSIEKNFNHYHEADQLSEAARRKRH